MTKSAIAMAALSVIAVSLAVAGDSPRNPEAKGDSNASSALLKRPQTGTELSQWFEVEGLNPFNESEGPFEFSALKSRYNSGHGHGWRNEAKVKSPLRLSAPETREHFRATVQPSLPNGAKTIVCQYHVDGLETILKVYVQDVKEGKLLDGVEGNGVFDVLARILKPDGKETSTPLGTVKSGESFELSVDLENGEASVSVASSGSGTQKTGKIPVKDFGRKIYFKFGDYLQAQDKNTGSHTSNPQEWDEYFKSKGIDSSGVAFSKLSFWRD